MIYVIDLEYIAPLAEVERHLEEHREFLRRHYAQGHFLMSGPKEPRTGGIILAQAESLETVRQWVAEDPFHAAGVARYEVTGWAPNMSAPGWPGE
ncbi:MAG: YciI family protein [Acidihalobacter sp.]|jgi:uncharacterized protein YciI|uniref:YciI family protein n=1 Tax=Acidihalobacter sp. TaxID=1872108 RepID=UPI00307F1332